MSTFTAKPISSNTIQSLKMFEMAVTGPPPSWDATKDSELVVKLTQTVRRPRS